MVLESIIDPAKARKNPWGLFFVAFVLVTIGIWTTNFMFKESTSILTIALTVVAMMPFIHSVFILEEEEETRESHKLSGFITRHFDVIYIYAVFFIGLTFSYAFWYVMLPAAPVDPFCDSGFCMPIPDKMHTFKEQEKTFSFLSGDVTSRLSREVCLDSAKKNVVECTQFIFANNSIVLGLAILTSFIYGAGALFLISWNASVIALFIGKEVVEKDFAAGLFRAIGYLPHGLPEVFAYFLGGIAGGIISVALTKKYHQKHELKNVVEDVILCTILAYALLFLAALIEAYLIVL